MPLLKAKSDSFFSHSFFIFTARFFPLLANLLVIIWYSKRLPTNVYGDYQHFWIQLNTISPIVCFGIHVVVLTYSPQFIAGLRQRIKGGYYVLFVLWMCLFSALFAWLQYSALHIPFALSFFFMLGFSLNIIFEAFLIVNKNYAGIIITNLLYAIAYCFIHWNVWAYGFSLLALFSYLMVLTMCRFCMYALVALWNRNRHRQSDETDADMPGLADVRKLWIHLGIYDVTQLLFNYIDKFAISLLLSASVTAVYYNGSQTIPFLSLLTGAAGSSVLLMLANRGETTTEDITALMNKMGRYLSCVVFPVFFFLFFFRSELIITLFGERYAASIPIFMVCLLVLPVRAYSYTTVQQKLHRGSIINAASVADIVLACALMYPLYRWMGLAGIALSFVISTYLQASFYLIYSARLLKTSVYKLAPLGNWAVKLIVFSFLFIGIRYAINLYFTGKIALILGGVMMAVVIMAALWAELKQQRKNGITTQPPAA